MIVSGTLATNGRNCSLAGCLVGCQVELCRYAVEDFDKKSRHHARMHARIPYAHTVQVSTCVAVENSLYVLGCPKLP